MGYFNYRFIRELLKNKKVKKILFSILIFILLIIIKNTVFGFSLSDVGYNDLPAQQVEFIYDNILKYGYNYDSYYVGYYVSGDDEFTAFYFFNYDSSNPLYLLNTSYYNVNYYVQLSTTDNFLVVVQDMTNNVTRSETVNQKQMPMRSYYSYGHNNVSGHNSFACNRDIYTDSSLSTKFFTGNNKSQEQLNPYIINKESIPTWNFSTLNISGGYQFQGNIPSRSTFTLYIYYANYYSTLNIKPYMVTSDIYGHIVFYVPIQQLLGNYNIVGDETLHFVLKTVYTDTHTNGTITDNWDLGTYTLNIDSSTADSINSNSSKQQLTDINNSIQEQTQVLEQQTQVIQDNTEATQHLENTITDDTVTSTASDLPSVDVNDPSQNGIDNIFQSIYNAFCTGQAQDIVFPIPFTNKNITLSPYYVRDMLNNYGATWIYTLIQAFWGYIIGRYIVKDVSKKITKIKGGNIENLENENIKEEML